MGAQGTEATGVITGCVPNSDGTGTVHIRDTCEAGETAVTWNHAGPQGPAGSQGATGARGADGADSAALTRVETAVTPEFRVGFQELTVKCRPGEHVVTGGYRVDNPPDFGEFRVRASNPLADGSGWHVWIEGWYSQFRVIAFAACAPQGA